MSYRVLVCGGRRYDDAESVFLVLNYLHKQMPITHLVSGMAPGADMLGVNWARRHDVPVLPFPAHWSDLSQPDALIKTRADGSQYDARAGIRRNRQMMEEARPDLVVAFPGGSGTEDMVKRARDAKCQIVRISGPLH